MAIYMQFGSVKGKVTTKGYEDWIELGSFQFGVGRGVSSPHGSSSDREASAPSVSEITVSSQMDASSNPLFTDAVAGVFKSTVIIAMTTTGQGAVQEFVRYTLSSCGLSGYSVSSGGDRPSESMSLNFTKVEIKYTTYDKDNNPSPNTVSYDLATMTSA